MSLSSQYRGTTTHICHHDVPNFTYYYTTITSHITPTKLHLLLNVPTPPSTPARSMKPNLKLNTSFSKSDLTCHPRTPFLSPLPLPSDSEDPSYFLVPSPTILIYPHTISALGIGEGIGISQPEMLIGRNPLKRKRGYEAMPNVRCRKRAMTVLVLMCCWRLLWKKIVEMEEDEKVQLCESCF